MPASNHTLSGTVQAIQYTGSNVAEIQALFGTTRAVYSNPVTSTITISQPGYENLQLASFIAHSTDWLVSQPSYDNTTPAVSAGFFIVANSQFTQQYSA